MRILILVCFTLCLASCWEQRPEPEYPHDVHVWGNKPVYSAPGEAKLISYLDSALPVISPGNIYVKENLIYQVELGKGIHVIDNSTPSAATRVGFILVNGCSQISIKDSFLYTNNYDDLVVLNISNRASVTVARRVSGTFPEGARNYFYMEPIESGYYECPRYDSLITGWVKDSIWTSCIKN